MKHTTTNLYDLNRLRALFLKACMPVVCGLIILPSASAQSPPPAIGVPDTLSVHTGRPLAEMLNKVQALFLTPIDYEEVPHESSAYLKSITITKPAGPQALLATPIADFSVTLGPADSSACFAALSVLQAHKTAGLPGEYKVVQNAGSVDVLPVQVLAASGSMRDVAPVMSQSVTIPFATRRVSDLLQLIMDGISKGSGARVLLLNIPFAYTDMIDFGVPGEPARDAIADLSAKINRPLSFQCLYDPSDKTYYLNLAVVAPAPVPGTPLSLQKVHAKPDGPRLSPPDSPFFIKTK